MPQRNRKERHPKRKQKITCRLDSAKGALAAKFCCRGKEHYIDSAVALEKRVDQCIRIASSVTNVPSGRKKFKIRRMSFSVGHLKYCSLFGDSRALDHFMMTQSTR